MTGTVRHSLQWSTLCRAGYLRPTLLPCRQAASTPAKPARPYPYGANRTQSDLRCSGRFAPAKIPDRHSPLPLPMPQWISGGPQTAATPCADKRRHRVKARLPVRCIPQNVFLLSAYCSLLGNKFGMWPKLGWKSVFQDLKKPMYASIFIGNFLR